MSRRKKIGLIILIIFGISWYSTYNLKHYSIYYAKRLFGENIDILAYYAVTNLDSIDLLKDDITRYRYRLKNDSFLITRENSNATIVSDDNGYSLYNQGEIYFFNKKGKLVKGPFGDYDVLNFPESQIQKLSKRKELLLAPLIEYQNCPRINLQWLFNLLNL